MALYQKLFLAKTSAKPNIDAADGKILKELIGRRGTTEMLQLLQFFFEHPPNWVERNGKFTLRTFRGAYDELLVLRSRQQHATVRKEFPL